MDKKTTVFFPRDVAGRMIGVLERVTKEASLCPHCEEAYMPTDGATLEARELLEEIKDCIDVEPAEDD